MRISALLFLVLELLPQVPVKHGLRELSQEKGRPADNACGTGETMKFKKKQKLLNGALITGLSTVERKLKNHGEAHMADDLLPQFTELVKKGEKLEGQLNFKLNDGPIHNHSVRIAELEKKLVMAETFQNNHIMRIVQLEKRLDDSQNGLITFTVSDTTKSKKGRPRKD